ncbi:hypothetical protein [Yoonia sp. BS5-3]|uniref:Thiocillin family RiPP n=1 Tax=Yoonia phaeophyticola TaxID=3137369 RepID=A0ABZ2V9F3_9RHOB
MTKNSNQFDLEMRVSEIDDQFGNAVSATESAASACFSAAAPGACFAAAAPDACFAAAAPMACFAAAPSACFANA